MDESPRAVGKGLPDKTYGQIWQEFLAKAVQRGYSPAEARRVHVKWRSVGKKLKAGRW